jgi:hypothetical protein
LESIRKYPEIQVCTFPNIPHTLSPVIISGCLAGSQDYPIEEYMIEDYMIRLKFHHSCILLSSGYSAFQTRILSDYPIEEYRIEDYMI